jgi:hypothetical protein
LTHGGKTVTLYLNGACVGKWKKNEYNRPRDYDLNKRKYRVGKDYLEWNTDADVDEIKFFNRTMSAAEVKADFESKNFMC